MEITSFLEAKKHAGKKRREAGEIEYGPIQQDLQVDPILSKYIFDLQERVEKEGRMDYRRYAESMWRELVKGDPHESKEGFSHFENAMIQRLHDIDMRECLYPEVTDSFEGMIKRYGNDSEHIALWSNGDVEATGYQPAKIVRSRAVESFYDALLKTQRKPAAKKFIREKTSYMVDDNKMGRLADMAEEYTKTHPEEMMKVVIIEDSRKNITRARQAIDTRLKASARRVEVVPIWAAYSREGQDAKKKAEQSGSLDAFAAEKASLNGIDSFSDLLDEGRFGSILKDAHVFVDFDGVIGDNVRMRELQAQIIAGSLIEGVRKGTESSNEDVSMRLTASAQEFFNG